jgi:hypothetical protein
MDNVSSLRGLGLNFRLHSRNNRPSRLRFALPLLAVGLLVVGLVTSLLPNDVAAATTLGVNQQINFQGRLLNNAGAVVADGTYNMRFELLCDGDGVLGTLDTACNGNATNEFSLWSETHANPSQGVVVKNGYFSVQLGNITSLSGVNFNQTVLWLSMEVTTNGTEAAPTTWNGKMTPFKRLSSAAYALNANQLQGLSANAFAQLAASNDFTNAAAIKLSGAPGSGGSLLQAGGSVLSSGSTNGTYFGANNATFSGDFINFQVANSTKLKVTAGGATTMAGALTVQSGGASIAAASGAVLTLDNGASTASLLDIKDNGASMLTMADGGAILFKNAANSNFALEIKEVGNGRLLRVDTANQKIGIGAYSLTAADNLPAQLSVYPTNDNRIGITVTGFSATQASDYYQAVNPTTGNIFRVQSSGDIQTASGVFMSNTQSAASTSSNSASFKSGDVSGATSDSGLATFGSGNSTTSGNTGGTTFTSGTAANGNSGSVTLDAGGATGGTKGTVFIGTANTPTINIGRTASATTTTVFGTSLFTNTLSAAGSHLTVTTTNSPTAGGTTNGISQTFTNSPTSTIDTAIGHALTMTDSTALANTLQGMKIAISDTGSAGKTVQGLMVDLSGSTNASSAQKATGILVKGAANTTTGVTNLLMDLQDSGGVSQFKVASTGATTLVAKNQNGNGNGDQTLTVVGGTPTSNNAGGVGLSVSGGAGGAAANVVGGQGGDAIRATGGNGGNGTGAAANQFGGQGGGIALAGGNGGTSANFTGGQGGGLVMTAGNGGVSTSGTGGAGGVVQITAGNAAAGGGGNGVAGDIVLTAGLNSGSTARGQVKAVGDLLAASTVASATAFQVQNAAGTGLFIVNSTTNGVSVNQGALSVLGIAPVGAPTITLVSTGGTLANTTTYRYRLAAYNAADQSEAVTSSPALLTTVNATSHITMSWSAVTNATGYYVYRSIDGGTTWFRRDAGNVTSFDDTGALTWSGTNYAGANSTNGTSRIYVRQAGQYCMDAACNSFLSESPVTGATYLTNNTSGKGIFLESDSFEVHDTTGFNTNLQITNTGATTFRNRSNSTAALRVQNQLGTVNVLAVDTSTGSGEVVLGMNNSTTGVLTLNNAGTTNQFRIQGAGSTSAAQTWTLPVATPTAGNCLTSSTTGAAVTLLWNSCGGGGGARLDQITAATTTATIANGTNAINWNWGGFSAAGTGLTVGETAASTGGSNNQYLLSVATAAGSTASPFRVTNAGTADTLFTNSSSGNTVVNLSGTGDFIVQDAGTAFLTLSDTGGLAMTLDATDNPSIAITNAGSGSFNYNMTGSGSFLVQNAGTNSIQVNSSGDVFLGKQDAGRFVTIGTGVSGNKTPTLLMLDQRGVATDPSFFEGGMYYNAFNQKFRCAQAAAWTDCIGSGGSGATTALDNLASVNINTKLLFNSALTTAGIAFTGSAATANGLTFTGQTATAGTGGLVTIQGGNTVAAGTNGGVTVDTGTGATTANGAINLGTVNARNVNINNQTGAARTSIKGGVLTTTNNTDTTGAGVVIGTGYSTSDTNLIGLTLDSSASFTETANTCATNVNYGTLYFNAASASGAVRACVQGAWEDLVSTRGLGLITFGVVPDSGVGQGDIAGAAGNTLSPCKVTWASATSVTVQACTAYSGGRKVNVSSTTLLTNNVTAPNVSLAASNYANICLNGTDNQPKFNAGNATENLAGLPTWSANNPVLCLATVQASATAGNVGKIYDVRTFTTTQKTFVTFNALAALGTVIVQSTTTSNQMTGPTTGLGTAGAVRGVLVLEDSAGASSTTVNAIIATAGPQWVKWNGTTGSYVGAQYVMSNGTNGYVSSSATAATAVYNNLGVVTRTVDSTCTAATNCQMSQLLNPLQMR